MMDSSSSSSRVVSLPMNSVFATDIYHIQMKMSRDRETDTYTDNLRHSQGRRGR